MKLGVITVGQSPRTDFTDDAADSFAPGVELLQRGALDSFTRDTLPTIAPEKGDAVLVSRMRDGSQATFAEKHVLPLMQKAIDDLEAQGCPVILLLCTGKFPAFRHNSLLIKPQEILPSVVERIAGGKKLGIMVPEKEQIPQMKQWWTVSPETLCSACGSPYGDMAYIEQAARELKDQGAELVFLDCMGYTREMKKRVSTITGTPVIIPRMLIVRIINEILEGQGCY